ncbi:hypothetical protein AGOR_G00188540 [Albula goreensis]|uniref:Uncharacterized protein n=1 Tax=Albula goreensis TaxID=1534307 RepID=A0A8T3CQ99_9TELE|nr:hypothetical protein AGOR_G00188540 [Albula goreensis]
MGNTSITEGKTAISMGSSSLTRGKTTISMGATTIKREEYIKQQVIWNLSLASDWLPFSAPLHAPVVVDKKTSSPLRKMS